MKLLCDDDSRAPLKHIGEGRAELQVVAMAALLRQGRPLEDQRRQVEALRVHDRAMALPEAERTPFDMGRLLHRISGCALAIGDTRRAFASYVAAGRQAYEIAMARHCGESLVAGGTCLVAHPLTTPIHEALDEDLVGAASHGVIEEAQEVLLGDGILKLNEASVIHPRLAGLTIPSASALLNRSPSLAANVLYHEVLLPFSDRHGVRRPKAVDDPSAIAFVFETLARLCDAVGEQGRQHRARISPASENVASMARFVTDAFLGPKKPMRRRFGSYLRDHRGAAWATGEHLSTAVGRCTMSNGPLTTAPASFQASLAQLTRSHPIHRHRLSSDAVGRISHRDFIRRRRRSTASICLRKRTISLEYLDTIHCSTATIKQDRSIFYPRAPPSPALIATL